MGLAVPGFMKWTMEKNSDVLGRALSPREIIYSFTCRNSIEKENCYRILPIIGASPNRGAPYSLGDPKFS